MQLRTATSDDAVDGDALLGFAHVIFDDDPVWGALVDNLHVVFERKHGGEETGEESSELEGGGTAVGVRYCWRDPTVLLNRGAAPPA